MSNNNVYGGFAQALFFSGSVSIPRFLLDQYTNLGITDREMMLIIHILNEVSQDENKNIPKAIMTKMGISAREFNKLITSLKDKGLISSESKVLSNQITNNSGYDFSGLIDQLFELWGIKQFKKLEKTESLENSKLVSVFERELGRPLTAFECEHLEKWLEASFSEEVIIEALRRGVSAGIRNFRYLDSILREWEKKGIRTLLEIEAEDEYFQSRKTKKAERNMKSKQIIKSKYDDIYL
ncbi:MAG: DnaD domain-containing protein [Desulfitobacteriia bacterium]